MDTTNEPVAWLLQTKTAHKFTFKEPTTAPQGVFPIPLYTQPAKTLTDEEIRELWKPSPDTKVYVRDLIAFARAILQKVQGK